MIILSIETSCDETAIALVEADISGSKPTAKTLAHIVQSQVDIHKEFGGVFPAVAKREHAKNLIPTLAETIEKAGDKIQTEYAKDVDWQKIETILAREHDLFSAFKDFLNKNKLPKIDVIMVTRGPGLEPALWVGVNFAKALSVAINAPLMPINHMEGHALSVFFDENGNYYQIDMPAMALLISGGHTEIILIDDIGKYKRIGETRDDATGEAFDKIARLLGLPYPGGPEISKLAEAHRQNNKAGQYDNVFGLPRPMLNSKDFDFSFSGLKTAVLYSLRDKKLNADEKMAFAREAEDAIRDVLLSKTVRAINEYGTKSCVIGGGVSANKYITSSIKEALEKENVKTYLPTKLLSTDNAVMIAFAGILRMWRKIESPTLDLDFEADGNLSIA